MLVCLCDIRTGLPASCTVLPISDYLILYVQRIIISEGLRVNDNLIFSRNGGITYGNNKHLKPYLNDSAAKNISGLKEVADSSLQPTELFLTNGFKNIFSPSLAKLIIDWFDKKFMVIYRADSIKLIRRFVDQQKSSMYIEKTVNEAAKLFGINSNALGFFVSDNDADASLCSVISKGKSKQAALLPAELFESYGTIRFINIFPLVIRALQTGATLIGKRAYRGKETKASTFFDDMQSLSKAAENNSCQIVIPITKRDC